MKNITDYFKNKIMNEESYVKFKFCDKFIGTNDVSDSKRLRYLDHELRPFRMNEVVPPQRYLKSVDLLLTDDAAEWTEGNGEVSRLLRLENPTAADVAQFVILFKDRFPVHNAEDTQASISMELQSLKQRSGERGTPKTAMEGTNRRLN